MSPPLLLNSVSAAGLIYPSRRVSFTVVSEDKIRISYPVRFGGAGIETLEVTGFKSKNPVLAHMGKFSVHNTGGAAGYNALRSFVSGDSLFIANAPAIWSANWGQENTLVGPVHSATCEREAVYGVRINVERVADFGPTDLCDSVVTITDNTSDYSESLAPDVLGSTTSVCSFVGALDQMGDYDVQVDVPGITEGFERYAYVDGSYCNLLPVELTIEAGEPEFCNAHEAPAFVMGITTPDNNHDAACKATMEAYFLSGGHHSLEASPKSDLAPDFAGLFGEDVQCVIREPVNNGGGGARGFDFDLEVEGYKNILAWSRASSKGYRGCLVDVVVFQASLEPL